MTTRRVNLCFNLDNDKASKAYRYIKEQSAKTAFVTEAVIYYAEKKDNIDKLVIKKAIREVIEEYDLDNNLINVDNSRSKDNRNDNNMGIPNDVFDLIINM